VINISEGQRSDRIERWSASCLGHLLDVHRDRHHHRAVFTMVGEAAARSLTAEVVTELDLSHHLGVHPRIGVVDVVPFVPLAGSSIDDAIRARDDFAAWAWDELSVPAFLYGPERSLPEVRRLAAAGEEPDVGQGRHARAGAIAVGARRPLVAYNVWLHDPDIGAASAIARELRGPAVRALAFAVGEAVQVSMNLIDPINVGPADVYDAIAARAAVERAELVGLIPANVLNAIAPQRWPALDLAVERTVEARLALIDPQDG
jgi:glutamate formiminotransferase